MKIKLAIALTLCFLITAGSQAFAFSDPPMPLKPGAVDMGNKKASFTLWAPGISGVSVIGDFNNWDSNKNPMECSSDGTWWTIIELWPGEYRYQFSVEGKKVGDPYARDVEWDANGPNGIIEMGARPFNWTDHSWQTPKLNELIIYELHTGDFSPSRDFKGIVKALDYLKGLGINAIELLPITEFPGDISWGYNPVYFMAPETAYGTPTDLKNLVNEAHKRGIAVILDMVFNHVAHEHPFNQLYPYNKSPWFSTDSNPWGFPDLNHWSDATKFFIKTVLEHWIKEYHIDGFRYDYTTGIGYDGINGVSYMTWAAKQAKSDIIQIAEHLPEDPHMIKTTNMDSTWHDTFHDQMKANLREGVFENSNHWGDMNKTATALHFGHSGYSDNAQVINYVESHDEERIIREAMSNPNINLRTAVEKSKLGLAMMITGAGVPMLYHGQEFGMDTARTIDPNPLDWNRAKTWPGNELLPFYTKMLKLRRDHRCLRLNGIEITKIDHNKKVIVFKRWDEFGDVIVVAANFDKIKQNIDIPMPYNGNWQEFVYDYWVTVTGNNLGNHEIPGSAAKIFILKN